MTKIQIEGEGKPTDSFRNSTDESKATVSAYLEFKDKTGKQLEEDTDMGPMITEAEAIRVVEWTEEAVSGGATLLTGGSRQGTLVPPTVLEDVPKGVRLDCDEIFGPVVCLYRVKDLEQAVAAANDVDFGLHGAIFTKDIKNAFYAIQHMDVRWCKE